MKYSLEDIVVLKKQHICKKSNLWTIIRMGADIKVKCHGCGHVVVFKRSEFDLQLKKVVIHDAVMNDYDIKANMFKVITNNILKEVEDGKIYEYVNSFYNNIFNNENVYFNIIKLEKNTIFDLDNVGCLIYDMIPFLMNKYFIEKQKSYGSIKNKKDEYYKNERKYIDIIRTNFKYKETHYLHDDYFNKLLNGDSIRCLSDLLKKDGIKTSYECERNLYICLSKNKNLNELRYTYYLIWFKVLEMKKINLQVLLGKDVVNRIKQTFTDELYEYCITLELNNNSKQPSKKQMNKSKTNSFVSLEGLNKRFIKNRKTSINFFDLYSEYEPILEFQLISGHNNHVTKEHPIKNVNIAFVYKDGIMFKSFNYLCHYCEKCKVYFDFKHSFEIELKNNNISLDSLSMVIDDTTKTNDAAMFDKFKKETLLHRLGYKVGNSGLRYNQRIDLLDNVIKHGIMSVADVKKVINNNIEIFSRRKQMLKAVEDWNDDLHYLNHYRNIK